MERGIRTGLEAKEGRRFGLTVGAAFIVFGVIAAWRGRTFTARVLWGIGGLLLVGAAVTPGNLKPVERVWMFLAVQMSRVMTPILMGVIYFFVLTPIAVLVRSTRGSPLVHRSGATGYWFVRNRGEDERSDMRRQF